MLVLVRMALVHMMVGSVALTVAVVVGIQARAPVRRPVDSVVVELVVVRAT